MQGFSGQLVTVQIDKSFYDESCMILVGQNDIQDDIWYVKMDSATYERMIRVTNHGTESEIRDHFDQDIAPGLYA